MDNFWTKVGVVFGAIAAIAAVTGTILQIVDRPADTWRVTELDTEFRKEFRDNDRLYVLSHHIDSSVYLDIVFTGKKHGMSTGKPRLIPNQSSNAIYVIKFEKADIYELSIACRDASSDDSGLIDCPEPPEYLFEFSRNREDLLVN